jgi:ABC-type sugar transport system ATPase subunit
MTERPESDSAASPTSDQPLLRIRNAKKSFGGSRALDGVSFELRKSEIHAIVGENGAGKSTLIKLVTGALEPDSGIIEINGRPFESLSAEQARALGIGVVYQEFTLLPELTVAENIFLGAQPHNRLGLIDVRARNRRTRQLLGRLGVNLDPDRLVRTLTVGEQQIVEVAKALTVEARILIMDEPSAVLPTHDLDRLFALVRVLRNQGTSVIYISHRLAEIYQLADRVTVMKDGRSVGTRSVSETTRPALVEMMVGRPLSEQYPARATTAGEPVLQVRNLSVDGEVTDVSFAVRAGEIVGLAGLGGSGRTTVCRALVGLGRITAGEIRYLGGTPPRNPRDAARLGIVLIPEDRARHGLVLDKSIGFNIALPWLPFLRRFGIMLNRPAEESLVGAAISDFGIRPPRAAASVQTLSGGNQQKVVLGKWLARRPRLVVFDEPTRGIDVGARSDIYDQMRRFAEQGCAIIMASSDLPEILGMSDRIIVLHEGRQVGSLSAETASEQAVMQLATGESPRVP